MGQTNIHTQPLSSQSVTINASDKVLKATILVTAGTVTYNGSYAFQGTSSAPIELAAGQGVTITSDSTSQSLDGVTIDASAGTCNLLLSVQ
jgi:hypothetical protein